MESKTKALTDAKLKLKEVDEQVAQLKAEYNDLVTKKEKLRYWKQICLYLFFYRQDSENTAIKLERAEKLVSGLASEKTRWEKSITEYEAAYVNLPGDCLLAASFLSYCGPFTTDYRQQLKITWTKKTKGLNVNNKGLILSNLQGPL